MNKREIKSRKILLLQLEYLSNHRPNLNPDFIKVIIEYLSNISLVDMLLISNCIDTFDRRSKEFFYFTKIHINLLLNKKYQEKIYDPLINYYKNDKDGYKMSMFKTLKFMNDHDWKHIEKRN